MVVGSMDVERGAFDTIVSETSIPNFISSRWILGAAQLLD
jgi:hypothetical protein